MTFLGFVRANARWLAAGVLLSFTSSFGQTFFISVFAGEIRAGFGLSHGQWGGIYSLGTLASAAVMVWAGGLTDRFRIRALGAAVLVLLSLACLSMGLVTAAWALPGVIFLLRFAGQGMTSHLAVVAMARWFVATRGKALSVSHLGFAAGEALLPVIFVAALGAVHWQTLWLAAAVLPLLAIPVLARFLRVERTPRAVTEETHAAGMDGRHWRRGEMLRHPLFWTVVPATLAPSAFVTALFFQQVHLSGTKGWDHVGFVALFPVYTLVSIAAMLGAGWAIDRFGTARLMPVYLLPLAVAFLVFGAAESLGGVALGFAVLAVSVGANSTIPGAFWAEFYGTRHLGAIKALATAVMVLGSAIGPGVTGALIDMGLPFEAQMTGIAALVLAAALLVGWGVRRAAPRLAPAAEIDVVGPAAPVAGMGLHDVEHDRRERR